MSYKVYITSTFEKAAKRLSRKYKSLKSDLTEVVGDLTMNPTQGTSLGNNCYKIRLKIKSKNKGKSGGARLITCVKISSETVYLLSIYDKSEKENLTDVELAEILKLNELKPKK